MKSCRLCLPSEAVAKATAFLFEVFPVFFRKLSLFVTPSFFYKYVECAFFLEY